MTPVAIKYSQYEEQEYILRHTPVTGRFLDVGAYHPTCFSNTRALYERGWDGVMIEPSPEPFLALMKEYGEEPRVTLIHAALGMERCLLPMWATADAVSTTSAERFEQWKHSARFYGKFYTPVFTWNEFFNQFGGDFQFVNIDTEGTSVDLLFAMLECGPLPGCICVEHDDRIAEILRTATPKGYAAVYGSDNLVLVR